jgi:CHASE3 domain sensor protein
MTATQIDDTYNELVSSIDREFRRLKQALAEQEMKEEAERLKTIQVRTKFTSNFLINKNMKYLA